jgi:hypothetical protein
MKAKTIFITVDFDGEKRIDYPQNLPIPRVGESVGITSDGKYYAGKVNRVFHSVTENLAEVTVFCER